MKRLILFGALCLPALLAGCIHNDLPYPVVTINIEAIEAEGLDGAAQINAAQQTVILPLLETTDIRNVHRIFESEAGCAHILHNVSLAVNPGEFVAITGPSGSGKSTLMNILGCLDKPTAGDYYLQGLNVAELDDDELTEVRALSIGFVFQSFNLLPRLSVIENVMLPLAYTNVSRSQREMRAVHALQAVTLPVDHWDHRISELSGGQMQRVAIARALVNDPPIILADEPTGNLDSATGALVMETFHKLQKRGKTIVLITHDPGIAAEADRAVTIRDGRIHDGAYIPHAPRTLRSAVDSLPMISDSTIPLKGVME